MAVRVIAGLIVAAARTIMRVAAIDTTLFKVTSGQGHFVPGEPTTPGPPRLTHNILRPSRLPGEEETLRLLIGTTGRRIKRDSSSPIAGTGPTSRVCASLFIITLLWLTTGCSTLFGQEDESEIVAIPSWPRLYSAADGEMLRIYQPQIIHWDSHEIADARAAISLSRSGKASPALGTIHFRAKTEVDLESRRVAVSDFELLETRFPTLPKIEEQDLALKIEKDVMPERLVVTLDHIVANLERSQQQIVETPVKTDPPPIFSSTEPAVLLQFNGEPILTSITDSELRYVLNTNWDLLVDSAGTHYLLIGDAWASAPDVAGPWKAAGVLPQAFSSLPDDDNWKQTREHVPNTDFADGRVPRVFVSERPAELLLLDGQPKLETIPETNLQDVTNTESDLLFSTSDSHYYYLVSGRWFRSLDLAGPWTFATPDLPADFAKIPTDHRRASVRALVPGTPEAEEAVILSQIPQRGTVERGQAKPSVHYSGDPKFETIEGTTIARATNTPNDILRVGDLYYLCFQGVWFVSASPQGPWETADSIPDEIYEIPPSSPIYHVTYVRVYSSTPTTVVVGYTSGYMGSYYSYGTVVWGTGWYYSPYYYYPPYGYPYYYSYPISYGSSSWYNPATGYYGRGVTAYGPYGGIGRGAAYNPKTGTYLRGGAVWGDKSARGWARAYNPRTGTYAATRQGSNAYGSWGRSVVTRGDDWARTGHHSDDRGTVGAYKTSRGGAGVVVRGDNGSGAVVRSPGGDLYAGKDGNVYRRGEQGWEQHGSKGWNAVPQEQLDSARGRIEDRAEPIDRDSARQRIEEGRGSVDRDAARERAQSRERKSNTTPRDAERSRRPAEYGTRPSAGSRSRSTTGQLDRDRRGRMQGAQRHERYQSQSRSSARMGGARSSGRAGGGRMGGGRRR